MSNTSKVGSFTTVLTNTPAIQAAAYATGELIGGKQTLTTAVRAIFTASGATMTNTAMLQSVIITDLGKQSVNLDVVFFDTDPTNTSFTENETLDIDDVDLLTIIGVADVSDWTDFSDNSVGQVLNLGMPFTLGTGTSLYAAIVSRGTPTYVSTSDLTLRVGILLD